MLASERRSNVQLWGFEEFPWEETSQEMSHDSFNYERRYRFVQRSEEVKISTLAVSQFGIFEPLHFCAGEGMTQ